MPRITASTAMAFFHSQERSTPVRLIIKKFLNFLSRICHYHAPES